MSKTKQIADDLVKLLGKQQAQDYVEKMLAENIYQFPVTSTIHKMWIEVVQEIKNIKDGEASVN